ELLHRWRLELRSYRLKDDHACIACIPHICRCRVRNECGFVIAVEVATVREFHVHRPNHREANAVYPNRLPDGGQTAEQLLFQPRTKKYDTPAFLDIFRGDPTALRGHLIAHFTVLGINTPGRGFGKPL